MTEETSRLVGRDQDLKFLKDLMLRREAARHLRSLRQPLLVVEGARGMGKSALVGAVLRWVDLVAPSARIDFDRFDTPVGAREVLASLAFQLSRSRPHYGAFQFPRMVVGVEVLGAKLNLKNRKAARADVIALLAQSRDLEVVSTLLKDASGAALQLADKATGLPLSAAGGWLPDRVPDLVFHRLRQGRRGRRLLLGPAQDWYGHRDRNLRLDPIDVLVDLNEWQAVDAHDNQRKIGRLLCDAFLADLAEGFQTADHPDELSLNCLIVLEQADTPMGAGLTGDLADALRARDDAGGANPATIVATSTGTLLARQPEDTADADARTGWTEPLGLPRWLRLRLGDLTSRDVSAELAARVHREGSDAQITEMIMGLTSGHPGSVSLLLAALSRHPDVWREPELWLELPTPRPQAPGGPAPAPVARELVIGLVEPRADPDELLRELSVYAAANRRGHALAQATADGSADAGIPVRFARNLEPLLWPAAPGGATALLRRLLLRELALKDVERLPEVGGLPDPEPGTTHWSRTFGRLCEHVRTTAGAQDEADELAYLLALGDLAAVARRMDLTVGAGASRSWLTLLDRVTAAPRRPARPGADPRTPMEQMRALADAAALDGTQAQVAELVAARWIAADPMTGNRRRSLHQHIAHRLGSLVGRWPGDGEPIHEAAQRHQSEAERWT